MKNIESELKEKIFNIILNQNGNIKLIKKLSNAFNIDIIKAVAFDDNFDIKNNSTDYWNAYILKKRLAIGVENYYETINNENNITIGLMAFYDPQGNEIKTKHFHDWNILLRKIELQLNL
jgi:hypothetical protein